MPVSDEAEIGEVREDLLHSPFGILWFLPSGDDQFSGSKEQNHDLWILQPVDKPGELFWLILDPFEIEPNSNLVQVDWSVEICGSDNVLDLVRELLWNFDAQRSELIPQDLQTPSQGFNTLCPGQHELARTKYQCSNFWILHTEYNTREPLLIVFRIRNLGGQIGQIQGITHLCGSDNVLNFERLFGSGTHIYK